MQIQYYKKITYPAEENSEYAQSFGVHFPRYNLISGKERTTIFFRCNNLVDQN